MSVFDFDDNIKKIPFKFIFSSVVYSVTSRLNSLCLFFKGNINDLHANISFPENIIYHNISSQLTKKLFEEPVLVDQSRPIPPQLEDILKEITDISFTIESQCIPLDNHIHHILETAYEQFRLRTTYGMEWFQHPENVGYIHVIFKNDVHWFYPIRWSSGE